MAEKKYSLRRSDGVSAKTRARLILDAGMRPEDFVPDSGTPMPNSGTSAPAPLGGDPTRQVTQAEWERQKAEQKKRADEKYRRYKMGKFK